MENIEQDKKTVASYEKAEIIERGNKIVLQIHLGGSPSRYGPIGARIESYMLFEYFILQGN